MTALRRRVADPLPPILLIALAVVLVACGTIESPSPSGRGSVPPSSPTAVPGGPSGVPSAKVPSTTNTEFGRIWDGLPASFPKLAGQSATELGTPASGTFVVNGKATTLAGTLRAALVEAGWTVDVGSPLEDGSVVLEAAGPADGCKAEVRFTPLSASLIMTVLYGAACPFG